MNPHDFSHYQLQTAPTPAPQASHFAALVGVLNGPLSDADNNHVFIPVAVKSGSGQGVYKIAFNVESNAAPRDAQYYLHDEAVKPTDFPPQGLSTQASLSYKQLGLRAAQFKAITNGNLRSIVHSSVEHSELIAAYGFTFPGGLHDIHFNNGEPAGSGHANHPNQDGALVLYFHDATGAAMRRWIFIKFQTQQL